MRDRGGARVEQSVVRRRAIASFLAVIVAAGAGSLAAVASSSPSSAPSPVRTDLVSAFRHLLGRPERATELVPYVQSVNATLASSIAEGAVAFPSDDSGLTADGTASIGTIQQISTVLSVVHFSISDSGPNGSSQSFVGDAVLTDGRWKLSWATVCMLIETESALCPNPPTTLLGSVPLPRSLAAQVVLAHESPDLIRPQALAVLPDGNLLIVDSDRDQILRWRPNGHLSVFAGTGQFGAASFGRPAVDSPLPSFFGSQLAVAADGTVYATGGNGCGVLVIPTSGVLERAAPSLCDTSGVALSRSGTLYVATNSGVYRVARSGAPIEVASDAYPPRSTPKGVPRAIGFSPAGLAFEGNGDLDVYSDGPRAMWRLTPSGRLSQIGTVYAQAMASAPDGSVLVAGHGGSLLRVTGNTITTRTDLLTTSIAGYGIPGMRGGFEPNGIAVAPSGAVFLDTFAGNGWTDATSVAEFPPKGRPFQIRITTPVLDTLAGIGASGFPSSMYPAPGHAAGDDLVACPSPRDLEPFDASSVAQARAVAAEYNAYTSSFFGDLDNSDRSWWRGVVSDWTGDYDNDTHTVGPAWTAADDTFAPTIAHACGIRLVKESEVVVEKPSEYSLQVTHLFFLDRDGRVLVYFQAT